MPTLVRYAPCVPHWVMIQREAKMQIDDQFIHCAGFIGYQTERGFKADATCFFMSVIEDNHTFAYAITAGHAIKNLKAETVPIRVQRKPGLSPRVIPTNRFDWIYHPTDDQFVDVALYEIDWRAWDSDNDLDIVTLTAPNIIMTREQEEHFGFGLGSEVFIPSGFAGMVGEKRNIPVVRFGHVAAMALEPTAGSPRSPAFLIEMHSLGGMSGSPIMFHTDPSRRSRRQPLSTDQDSGLRIAPYFLIGMLLGAWSGKYITDFIATDDTIPPTDVEFNSGISVALPISQIIEVLNQPILVNRRRDTVNQIRLESGYRPLS
jgi:hypothetical protein